MILAMIFLSEIEMLFRAELAVLDCLFDSQALLEFLL